MLVEVEMAVFWVVPSCSLVEVYVSEVLTASIIRAMSNRPDDGGSKHLYTAQQQNTAIFILAAVRT
jgi:hypothetical protein